MKNSTPHNIAQVKHQVKTGVLAAIGCYVIWGFFPLYWKPLASVNPAEIIAQRVIWCFVFAATVCLMAKHNFLPLLRSRRALKILTPATLLVTFNWSLYIWAVSIDRVVESALGYYINPLVSILLGMMFFKERLSVLQWVAVALCCAGIGYITLNYGQFPWIAIVLALSFGGYGALKKKGGYPPVESIATESLLMVPVALAVTLWLAFTNATPGLLRDVATLEGWRITLLLIGGGAITAIPLILFAKATTSIPLTYVGFLQYISPTLALGCAVLVLGEPFTISHAICFGCIWAGCALVLADSLQKVKAAGKEKLTPAEQDSLREEEAAEDEIEAEALSAKAVASVQYGNEGKPCR